jgi:hypothetical protein
MSNKGFLILAQNNESVDYVRQAYALALSIVKTQSTHKKVSLLTNDTVPEEYKHAFDQIIPIPWTDGVLSRYAADNRWKFIYASPYDETIVLDSDMLFFEDISSVWDHLDQYELFFASKVVNFKNKIVTDTRNRQTFIKNNLPNVYFALHYFKKTEFSFRFYKTLELVVRNWQGFYNVVTPKITQPWVSMDVSAAIAIKLLDIEAQVTNPNLDFTFVHMKPNVQDWDTIPVRWTNFADFYVTDDFKLFVNQYKQNKIFHYTENEFLIDDILKILEEKNV